MATDRCGTAGMGEGQAGKFHAEPEQNFGYLPPPRHFELGGYETWPGTNLLEPQAAVKMLDALLEMVGEVAPKTKRGGVACDPAVFPK